ncbi:MAG: hypothetical protein NTW21_44565 [Verrucomicrobia bacterium]|nr:hypothetical protein [Verrucomicrobiota bacterium]
MAVEPVGRGDELVFAAAGLRLGIGQGGAARGGATPPAARRVMNRTLARVPAAGNGDHRSMLNLLLQSLDFLILEIFAALVRQAKSGFSIDLKCDQHVK